MYTLTVIRLQFSDKKFENTEVNRFMLEGDIEKELAYHNASIEQIKEFFSMKRGETKVIQVNDEINNKLWFYYIAKIN